MKRWNITTTSYYFETDSFSVIEKALFAHLSRMSKTLLMECNERVGDTASSIHVNTCGIHGDEVKITAKDRKSGAVLYSHQVVPPYASREEIGAYVDAVNQDLQILKQKVG